MVEFKESETLRRSIFEGLDPEIVSMLKTDRKKLLQEVKKIAFPASVNMSISPTELNLICDNVLNEILGYGPLQELIDDPLVTDILVNGPNQIYVERSGKLILSDKVFMSESQLVDIARRFVNAVGRRIDDSQPLVDARMLDGSRLNVVLPPIAVDGTAISIRKFPASRVGIRDLINYESISSEMGQFLALCAMCRVNIIVSGGTGSGKTTLLNAISEYISKDERIITIEDAAELKLFQPHVVRLETKHVSSESQENSIDIKRLLINALRMRPDRIIVGECRGVEAFEMLQAMNTGHDGSMSTLHANTPREAISRLESMIMSSNAALPMLAIRRNIVSSVNLVVQTVRLVDGSRKITHISELMGMEGEQVQIQDIFTFDYADSTKSIDNKIVGKFVFHGLLQRSIIYKNAIKNGCNEKLQMLIGGI